MKIGPIEIGKRKQLSEKPRTTGNEFGASGTTNYGGILTEVDYNQDWAAGYGSNKWKIIDEMRLSDGQVQGTLKYCKEPLIAANWSVEPVSDEAQDVEIADFVSWNLFEGAAKPWRYMLRHFLLALDFGVMLFEKVWAYDSVSGRYYCIKLAPRMPSTIFKWNEKDGDLDTVEQVVSTKRTDPIPAAKLIHFAIDQEFDNWEGRSILRSAYKHWKMKLAFEKVSAMSYERFGMGVPWFKEGADASDEDRTRADTILENLRAHESAGVRYPYDWEFGIEFGENWKPADGQIRYHNEMISAAVMQQFVNLGTMDRGSRAVGEVMQDPYYLSLESLAEQICETLNKHLIPEIVRYNWEGVAEPPKLKCSNIRAEDFTAISAALQALAGHVTPNFDTEQHLRQIMKLPELKEEEQREKMPEPDETGKPVEASEGGGNPLVLAEFRRPLTENEKHVDFAGINSRIDTAADALVAALAKVRKEQAKALAADLAAMAKTGRIDPNKVKVKFFGKAADAVRSAMREAYDFGKEKTAEELAKQQAADVIERRQQGERVMKEAKKPGKGKGKITRKSPPIDEVIENRADMVVAAESQVLKEAALRKIIPLLKEIAPDNIESTIYDWLLALSDKGLRTLCSAAITEGINEGRADYAAEMATEYATAVRSGLLDGNICAECEGQDGEEFTVEDGVEETLPDPACYGGDACRCIMIFVSREESKAVT